MKNDQLSTSRDRIGPCPLIRELRMSCVRAGAIKLVVLGVFGTFNATTSDRVDKVPLSFFSPGDS